MAIQQRSMAHLLFHRLLRLPFTFTSSKSSSSFKHSFPLTTPVFLYFADAFFEKDFVCRETTNSMKSNGSVLLYSCRCPGEQERSARTRCTGHTVWSSCRSDWQALA